MPDGGVTVVSSPQAKAAIQQMAGIINGDLNNHFDELNAHGRILSDPANFDGRVATEFRGDTWPAYQSAFRDVHAKLDQLKTKLNEIQTNIMESG